MNRYNINTLIQLQATFTTADGDLADPTAVSVSIQMPNGAINTDGATRVSIGVYTYDVSLTQAGSWIYNWEGTGAIQITSGDIYFLVLGSVVLS